MSGTLRTAPREATTDSSRARLSQSTSSMPQKRDRSTVAPDERSAGFPLLEGLAIRPASQQNYARTLMKFTQFCHYSGLTGTDARGLGATVFTFMAAMFLDGEGVHSGEAPLPRVAMFAITGALMADRWTQMVLAVALAFAGYRRPIKLMALQGGHLVPPVALLYPLTKGLVLHASTLGIPVKTGAWDAAAAVDVDSVLWAPLHALLLGSFGQKVEERFVVLLAKSVPAKGLPLSVPHVHYPETRERRPS